MEAIVFAASGVLIYKLWRGVQEGGPRTKAVEVRGIAERPQEPVAAQLPDASSTTTPAAQAEAVDSIMRAAVMPRPARVQADQLVVDQSKWTPAMREHNRVLMDEIRNDPAAARARILAAGAHYRESMKNVKVLTWDDAVKSAPGQVSAGYGMYRPALPDHSGDTRGQVSAARYQAVLPDHSGDTRGQVSAGYGFIGKVAPGKENSYTRAMAAQAAEKQRVMSRQFVTPGRL
jgi:hypothetical protein